MPIPPLEIKSLVEIEEMRKSKEETAKLRKEFEEIERQAFAQRHAQYMEYRAIHSFDNVVLDMNELRYALEGYFNSDYTLVLQQEVAHSVFLFSQMVRMKGFYRPTDEEIGEGFANMMKILIANAKTPSSHQYAAQKLLGFMMYHNFVIQHQKQTFRISDIVLATISELDMHRLRLLGNQYMPFMNQEWLQSQSYPGKRALEQFVVQNQVQPVNTFTPFFNQQQSQQSAVPLLYRNNQEAEVARKMLTRF